MRVMLAGGGTGGHVIPALAIARELTVRYAADVRFVGTPRGIETRLVPAAGYDLRLIEVGVLKQVSPATRMRTLAGLPGALLKAYRLVRDFQAHVVVGVGGYASGPAMLASIFAGVPALAYEPNRVPGFANLVIGAMVSTAAVQFAETCRYFSRARVTGVPIRAEFLKIRERPAHAAPTLLVFGGSQGAHAINAAMIAAAPLLSARIPGFHVIHQTGERDYNEVQTAYLRADVTAEVSPFVEDMPDAFARADLLLCRSGASTVAEVMAAGKPAILVPFPQAADNHQLRNAEVLADAGAARLLPETDLSPATLADEAGRLLADSARRARMARAARELAHPNAAAEIAEIISRLALTTGY